MNFKQVAHFYLGCEMLKNDGSEYTLLPSSMPNNFDKEWITYVGKPMLKKFPDDMSEQDEEETGLNKTYEKGHNELNPYDFWYLIKEGFDLFGLIENGEAVRR
jgi:hypothetical protein